ncbi:MAG: hypothetical protein ACI4WF_02660 [Bacilli bacterium]
MNDDKKKEIDEKVTEYYVEENERKYPSFIVLLLLTTFAVIAALGLSFSTITLLEGNQTINTLISRIKGENDDKERYIVTYVENTGPYKDKGIYLINQFPTSDSKGKLFEGENYVFHFSLLLGSKTKDVYYELTAVPNSDNTLNPKYVKLYLEKNGEGVNFSYNPNNKVKVFTDYKDSDYEETEGKVIYQDYITEADVKNKKIDFVMRMWISEDAKVDEDFMNKTFGVKINTYAKTK